MVHGCYGTLTRNQKYPIDPCQLVPMTLSDL